MPWFRAYVEKKNGGEFTRIIDLELEDGDFTFGTSMSDMGVAYLKDSGRTKLKLKKGEDVSGLAGLTFPEQANV